MHLKECQTLLANKKKLATLAHVHIINWIILIRHIGIDESKKKFHIEAVINSLHFGQF